MLISYRTLHGLELHATDGAIGQVKDCYFSDDRWTTRYLVIETGQWLSSRRVLIAPVALKSPDWSSGRLPVELTKKQVKESPNVDTAEPVSRQQEAELHRYYAWPVYWGGAGYAGAGVAGTPLGGAWVPPMGAVGRADGGAEAADAALRKTGSDNEESGDPHLRSAEQVKGYAIEARDGSIGHVEDFVIDTSSWEIRFIVIDTRNWLPGRKVVVPVRAVKAVDWHERHVAVDLDRETIKESPEYDDSQPLSSDAEKQLSGYFRL